MSSEQPLTVGSLFSGAGLMDWGLTLAGFKHAWFCESDAYCQSILRKRWPGVAVYDDIRGLSHPLSVDLLAGGFPCQDISLAGRGAGLEGARSGLWGEFARLIGELRPRYVFVENVSALLARGLGRVLGDLAALGYDAEWDCIPASAFGAPHRRDRVWLVAYPERSGLEGSGGLAGSGGSEVSGTGYESGSSDVADSAGPRWEVRGGLREGRPTELGRRRSPHGGESSRAWATEPDVGRVAYGVPARVDRLRALGNGAVPQIAQWIGERILEREAA